jgi:hypothetical protein
MAIQAGILTNDAACRSLIARIDSDLGKFKANRLDAVVAGARYAAPVSARLAAP